jgi:aspartate/methionine/tyrosine aminotransferase
VHRRARLSTRLPLHLVPNRITEKLDRFRREGKAIIDLTESNPTRANLPYPSGILDALGDAAGLHYNPHPFGLARAREAVADDCRRRSIAVHPDDVVLTASTSESYSWLFKLLCDPGDTVIAPVPSYPLFEHLARLENIELAPYRLEYHGRWEVDVDSLNEAPASTRAVIVVSPNNPTGSYVTKVEFDDLLAVCRARGWALIGDEVFADYPLDAESPLTDLAARADVLSFTLGGASKTLGLPQVKLGWMVVGGPPAERRSAMTALEHIADTFLSVSTPVQLAAPSLLTQGAAVRAAIHDRIRRNLQHARDVVGRYPSSQLLRVEGGWCATLRVPATRSEEILVLDLLDTQGVLVHPGYFFDFPHEAFVVVSLLVDETVFADAFERSLRFMN